MNENIFKSQRNHTRLKFQPLTTSCNLVCLTPQSPCAQSIDATGSTPVYNPNRELTPTVVFPDVRGYDPDRIFTAGAANAYLSLDSMQWLVNGEPIEDVWTLGTDYAINTTSTDLRGALTVYKNIPSANPVSVAFKGQFVDWRTKAVYKVESDEMVFITTDKGADIVKCSVDKPYIEYDPLYDDLLVYDYLYARGLETEAGRSDYVNDKNYEQTVKVTLNSGISELATLPTGVTMRVVRIGTSTALVPQSVSCPEMISISFPYIIFDMRLIDKEDYEVQFVKSSQVIAKAGIGLHRKTTMPLNGRPARNADIVPSMTMYVNTPIINLADKAVIYPEIYYLIRWFTQAVVATTSNGVTTYSYGEEKERQLGSLMQVPIKDLGIGYTYNDSFFEQWFDVEAHGASSLITDEEDDVLCDEDDEMLID